MRARFSSKGVDVEHTTSPRGTISEPIWRSSRRNTLRTMVCSCDSITPAVVPSASMAWISSSVTALPLFSFTPSRRSNARVEVDSSSTKGLVAMASQLMGRATRRARSRGGLANALGHQFADHDGEVGDRDHHQAGGAVAAVGLGRPATRARRQRRGQRGLADDAVEHADRGDADLDGGQEPRRVLAQLDRRSGRAPSPSSISFCIRALRAVTSAISDMANRPLSTMSAKSRAISMQRTGESGELEPQ
jgi:hypothetical protein